MAGGEPRHHLHRIPHTHQQVAAAPEQLAAQGDEALPQEAQPGRPDAGYLDAGQRRQPGLVKDVDAEQLLRRHREAEQRVVGQSQVVAQPGDGHLHEAPPRWRDSRRQRWLQ